MFHYQPNRIDRFAGWLSLQSLFYRETEVSLCTAGEIAVSPCRGKVARVARIGRDGRIPEKKRLGRQIWFPLSGLVQQDEAASIFLGGDYVNLYLSPWDYHFLIFPMDSSVRSVFHQDGFNWPVVAWEGAILRNSKMVTLLDTGFGFPLGLVMVASWMVGGMEPRFETGRSYSRGDVFARFRIGSTVVMLFPPGKAKMLCREGQKLELGAPLARIQA